MGIDSWRKYILAAMRERLAPLGFRKHGATFNKLEGDTWVVVNLQSSQWNVEGRLSVTINVALHYGKHSEFIQNPATGPKEYECHWRARPQRAGWWEITSDAEARRAAEDISTVAVELMRRAFAAYPTAEAALRGMPPGKHLTADPVGSLGGLPQLRERMADPLA